MGASVSVGYPPTAATTYVHVRGGGVAAAGVLRRRDSDGAVDSSRYPYRGKPRTRILTARELTHQAILIPFQIKHLHMLFLVSRQDPMGSAGPAHLSQPAHFNQ